MPVLVAVVAGRGWSDGSYVLWSGDGTGCLNESSCTNASKGVVVIVTEQADPIIVFVTFWLVLFPRLSLSHEIKLLSLLSQFLSPVLF